MNDCDIEKQEIIVEEFSVSNVDSYIACFHKTSMDNGECKYFCRVDSECRKSYISKSSAIRHLKKDHHSVYDSIKGKKTNIEEKDLPKVIEIRAKVNLNDIWSSCMDLIVFHSLPLSVLEGDAFKTLLKPYVLALAMKGIKLKITPETMKSRLTKRANLIKEQIKMEVKGKSIGLMIDIASRYSRSVLGVNISYILQDCIMIRTIGMHTLRKSQTAPELLSIIRNNLNDFEINIDEISSYTTDNGKNMTKCVALFDELVRESHNESLINYTTLFENFDSDEELDEEFFDEQYYSDLLKSIQQEFQLVSNCEHFVYGIRCAAHCIHLIVIHAIQNTLELKNVLDRVRSLVKKLRTTKYRNILKDNGLSIPTIDVLTRWNTIHQMVIGLFSCKDKSKNIILYIF